MIDLSRYDKRLPAMATVFKIPPVVFTDKAFIDISPEIEFLNLKFKGINKDIYNLLADNDLFYNCISKNGESLARFKPKTEIQQNRYNTIKDINTYMCDRHFILDMALWWKDYLDDSFHAAIDDSIA